jgi:hypothetical protein
MPPFHQLQKNDNKTTHEFKAISLHFTTEIVWGIIKPHVIKYASRMQAQKDYFYSAFFTFICLWFTRLYLFCPLFLFLKFLKVDLFVDILLKY